jgi:hypothetical protein
MSEAQQQPTGVPDGWEVVAPATPPPPPPLAETRMPAGVPARGRGTQFDPEPANRRAAAVVDTATTPLARPTGIGAIDSFTSPMGIASLAMGGMGLARDMGAATGGLGKAIAAARFTIRDIATPYAKYEAAKAALELAHTPSIIASPLAYAISGYRKNGKPAPAEAPHVPTAEGYSRYEPSASGYQAEATPSAVAPRAAAPAPPASASPSPAPSAPGPPVAPSALSAEEQAAQGLVQRGYPEDRARAALAAQSPSQSAAPSAAPAAPATPKPELKGEVAKRFFQLLRQGKTPSQAYDVLEAELTLQARLGLKTPTVAETKFPKGWGGKKKPE